MTFADAEARYYQLKGMLASGRMDRSAFEAAIRQLMLQDSQGRWWTLHQESGQWLTYDGANWVTGSPPGQVPPPPPQVGQCQYAGASGAAQASVARPLETRPAGAGGKMLKWVIGMVVFWAIVAVVVMAVAGDQAKPEEIGMGIGAAGLLSIVLMTRSLADNWAGVVERIEVRRVDISGSDDSSPLYENQSFAIIRLSNGRTKDMRAMPSWRVGDRLIKRQGESMVEKL